MKFIFFLLTALLLSCEPKSNPCGTDPLTAPESSIERVFGTYAGKGIEFIIDELDWFDLADGTEEQKCLGDSIAMLYNTQRGYRCTAFKVGKTRVMTNNHCASTFSDAPNITVTFNYDVGVDTPIWHQCYELVTTNSSMDYSILECDESMTEIPFVSLKETIESKEDKDVYILHQNCDYYNNSGCKPYKKISEGILSSRNGSRIFHSADSLGGTSGSPIFDKQTDRILGIHNSGYYHSTKPVPYGSINAGYSMDDIVKDLESKGHVIE